MIRFAIAFCLSQLCALSVCDAFLIRKEEPPSVQMDPQECGRAPHPMRVAARYTTPKGIGYNTGYATLEGFFASQPSSKESWLPFLDLRGHVFDNGKLAANAGLGLRYLTQSRVWGINGYYDYRNTTHRHYNQVASGLEALGRIWDFRINGYLPVGKKQTAFSEPKFNTFRGHYMLIERARHYSMKGGNAEVGLHVDHFKEAPLYFAGGPYYLTGVGETTWGGELRARVDLFHRYLSVEGKTSYDHFFKWIGQAQVSVNIPFGGRKKVTKSMGRSCGKAMALQTRALQPVDRHEIIPEAKEHNLSRAINPATGKPWYFWFVDNTSSSAGSYESPFPTLLDAQNSSRSNQVIYVFPGDGTTTGMDSGIVLKEAQMLLGASVAHPIITTKGTVIIPPMVSKLSSPTDTADNLFLLMNDNIVAEIPPSLVCQLPSITNTTGDVVTLASNNTVSGFCITANNGNGLSGISISNLIADQNIVVTSALDTNGIYLLNPSGQIAVTSSTFNGFTNQNTLFFGDAVYVELDTGNTLSNLDVIGSIFTNIRDPGFAGGCGIRAGLFGGAITNLNVSGCTFSDFGEFAAGLFASVAENSTITNLNISNSSFEDFSGIASGINTALSGNGVITNFNVTNNNFTGFEGSRGFNIQPTGSAAIVNFDISNNEFAYFSGGGLAFNAQLFNSAEIANLNVSNNLFRGIFDTSLGFVYANGSSGNNSLNLSSNAFLGNGNTSNGYAATISNSSGTICLNFVNNMAMPTAVPIPYAFTQTGGTFNRTSGSDSSTNTGQFLINGAVNSPGSCSQ